MKIRIGTFQKQMTKSTGLLGEIDVATKMDARKLGMNERTKARLQVALPIILRAFGFVQAEDGTWSHPRTSSDAEIVFSDEVSEILNAIKDELSGMKRSMSHLTGRIEQCERDASSHAEIVNALDQAQKRIQALESLSATRGTAQSTILKRLSALEKPAKAGKSPAKASGKPSAA